MKVHGLRIKTTKKISYWNEVFLICKKLGIDSHMIADIVGLDPCIGEYGTVHGKAFVSFAEKYRNARLLKAVEDTNEEMREKYGVRE